ncbi:hypothetical protein D3C80_730590 [compost metagenome]
MNNRKCRDDREIRDVSKPAGCIRICAKIVRANCPVGQVQVNDPEKYGNHKRGYVECEQACPFLHFRLPAILTDRPFDNVGKFLSDTDQNARNGHKHCCDRGNDLADHGEKPPALTRDRIGKTVGREHASDDQWLQFHEGGHEDHGGQNTKIKAEPHARIDRTRPCCLRGDKCADEGKRRSEKNEVRRQRETLQSRNVGDGKGQV